MQQVLADYLHGSGTLASVRSAGDFSRLCAAARDDPAGRLRWKLARRLGTAPWTGTPGRDEYLYALANLSVDRDEALEALCPACRQAVGDGRCRACGASLPTVNPGFDETRYEELKHDGSAL